MLYYYWLQTDDNYCIKFENLLKKFLTMLEVK